VAVARGSSDVGTPRYVFATTYPHGVSSPRESAALVTLLRARARPWSHYADLVE
jgi:hypothetical protein